MNSWDKEFLPLSLTEKATSFKEYGTEGQATLVVVNNPFRMIDNPGEGRTIEYIDVEVGTTLIDILGNAPIIPIAGHEAPVQVHINGKEVKQSCWSKTAVRPKDFVVVQPIIQGGGGGGGGGKNIMGTVAMIAVVVLAIVPFAFPALTGAVLFGSFTAAHLVSMGVLLIGGMLVNALFPPALPSTSATGDYSTSLEENSPTYAWSAVENWSEEGKPVPVLYGTMKITPYRIGRYVYTDGDNQYLSLLFLVADHVVDSITAIKINDNPYTYYDDVTVETRLGALDQTAISYFEDTRTDLPVQLYLSTGDYIEYEAAGNTTEGLGIGVTFPSGLYYVNNAGNLVTESVTFTLEYRAVGDPSWLSFGAGSYTVAEAQQSPVRRFYEITSLSPDQYEIRAILTAQNASSSRRVNDVMIEYVQTMVPEGFTYPGASVAGVMALATKQISGSRPRVTLIGTRSTVDVHNGTEWVTKPANNPAWAAYDMHVNSYYGLGTSYTKMIYDEFEIWADYCTLKGLEFNMYSDTAAKITEIIARAEEIGRGRVVKRGNNYGCIVDKPTDPVFTYSVGNIIQDSHEEVWLDLDERANVLDITYFDADLDYTRKTIQLRTSGFDASTEEETSQSLTLYGCTDKDIAVKHGRFLLNCNEYLTRTLNFAASVDSIAIQPGDVFKYQHDVPQIGYGGRVVSSSGTTVVLDQTLSLEAGTTYVLVVRHNEDDTIETKTVEAVLSDTETNTVTVTEAWNIQPKKYDVYTFGESGSSDKLYRCISINREQDLECRITALEYADDVYEDDGDTITVYGDTALDYVDNLRAVEVWVTSSDGSGHSASSLSWTGYGVEWQVYRKISGETAFDKLDKTIVPRYIDHGPFVLNSTYTYAVSGTSNPGEGETTNVTIEGKNYPPADVANFSASQSRNVVTFKWDQVADYDLAGYELRYTPTSVSNWSDAIVITKVTKGTLVTNAALPPGTWRLYIKARDTSGIYSTNATSILFTVKNTNTEILKQVENPSWTGTLTNLVFNPNTNHLIPESQNLACSGEYEVFDNFVWNPYRLCYYTGPEIDMEIDLDDARVWGVLSATLGPGEITGVADPVFQIDYKISGEAYDGFEDWATGTSDFRYLKPRLKLDTDTGVAYVTGMNSNIDKEERTEGESTVAVSSSGTTIIFTEQFYLEPKVNATAISETGVTWAVYNITTSQFSVKIWDLDTGLAIDGYINWTAIGV